MRELDAGDRLLHSITWKPASPISNGTDRSQTMSNGTKWCHAFALEQCASELCIMKRRKLALQFANIRGSIAKSIVVRHTPYGVIVQRYPDMSRIRPTTAQKNCRSSFRDAVAWAKQVIADPDMKKEWQKKLRRVNGVYNAAISFYMSKGNQFIAKACAETEQKDVAVKTLRPVRGKVKCTRDVVRVSRDVREWGNDIFIREEHVCAVHAGR